MQEEKTYAQMSQEEQLQDGMRRAYHAAMYAYAAMQSMGEHLELDELSDAAQGIEEAGERILFEAAIRGLDAGSLPANDGYFEMQGL